MFNLISRLHFKKFRFNHNLSEKLYPNGLDGRCSFNGRVVTIFGATGYLGTVLTGLLGQKGTQIVCPYRCTHHDVLPLKIAGDLGQIHLVEFDPYDSDSFIEVIQYSDTVINCIGHDIFAGLAKRSNIDMTELICTAINKCPNIKTFIHVSSMSQYHNNDIISKTKRIGEQVVRKLCPDATIIRPSSMYHRPDRFICKIAVEKNPAYNAIMKTYKKVIKHPTSTLDVAKAMVHIVLQNEYHGKTFELYSNECFYMDDIHNFIYNSLTKKYGINVLFWKLFPWKTLAKKYPQAVSALALVPAHFYLNDIPSNDPKVYRFEDIGIKPIDTETGIVRVIKVFREDVAQIMDSNIPKVYEQNQLCLISKTLRDILDSGNPYKLHRNHSLT